MKILDLFERVDTTARVPQTRHVTLYYGCCRGQAEMLERSGFFPSLIGRKYLTLVSTVDQARAMAKSKDCDAIVEVSNIPANHLQIDLTSEQPPEDIWEAIDLVNNGVEIRLKLFKQLHGQSFTYLNKLRKK